LVTKFAADIGVAVSVGVCGSLSSQTFLVGGAGVVLGLVEKIAVFLSKFAAFRAFAKAFLLSVV